ncbi:YciE/YciF ferroxidase family protein [Flavitalea sp.]|nr:ferritin-like domain-containing protein [Flavitalea sp.]
MDDSSALMELFVDGLKDIYWAENHLVKNLPKMLKAAGAPELKAAITDHIEVTKQQAGRLEKVFGLLEKKAQAKKCEAMEGLVKEGNSIIEETDKGTATRDVGIILAAQKIEHYEIATYGGLAQLAKTLGLEEVKNLLGQTLDEEKEADELLTQVAEYNINVNASQED